MKKIVCIAFLSIYCFQTQAQSTFAAGVKAGVNISHLSSEAGFFDDGSDTYRNFSSLTSFYAGGFFDLNLTKVYTLSPELLYSNQGSEYTFTPNNIGNSGTIKVSYLNMNIVNKFRITPNFYPYAGTSFDFRKLKRVGLDFMTDECQKAANGYDHAFVLDKQKIDGKTVLATVISPEGELKMDVMTTMPSIQFYTANFLAETKGKSRRYGNYSGLALETQYFPDGPNHPEWGENQGILPANQQWHSQTIYKFYQ